MPDSAIIALFPSTPALARVHLRAARLPVPPHTDDHLTLAYIGDIAALAPMKGAIIDAVRAFALGRREAALTFQLGPAMLMPNAEDDGMRAIAAQVRPSPDLRGLQAALVALLDRLGLRQMYPTWLPHLTLGYQSAAAAPPRVFVPRVALSCAALTLCWGETRIELPLGGALAVPVAAARKSLSAQRRALKAREFDESKVSRDDTGKFGSGSGGSKKPAPKPKPKPKPTEPPPEPPAAASQPADAFLGGLGLDPALSESLGEYLDAQKGDAPENIALNRKAAEALAAQGLITIDPGQEGSPNLNITLTGAGKKLQKAAEKGDIAGGMKVVEAGHKRAAAAADRAAKRQPKGGTAAGGAPKGAAPKAAAAVKPKGGGSGGGSDTPQDLAKLAQAEAAQRATAAARANALGRFDAATKAAPTHRYWRAYREARAKGALPHQARRQARTVNLQPRLDRAERQRAAVLAKMLKAPAAEVGTLTVFKEASGRLRWLIISSNGYEDRDREIVSTKALDDDVARTDADGLYGPLRWWHIGDPDPMQFKAPWGDGLDLGMCDWADMDGPFLIESGTFYDDEVGAALAAKAPDLEVSLGFFHPANEPDARGVFSHIRRFERSLAPKGRVSNMLTGFYVPTKEIPPMNQAKIKALAAQLEGVPEEKIQALITQHTSAREKTAQAQGLRLKAGEPQPVYEIAGRLFVLSGDQLVAVKAPMPAPEAPIPTTATKPPLPMAGGGPDDEADPADAAADEAMGEQAEEAGDFAGDLSVDDFKAMLVAALSEAIQPLLGQLKMADKMDAMVKMMGEEMKGYMTGVGAKDDTRAAEIAALKAQQATLSTKLATLLGETPRALKAGSEAESTAVTVPAAATFTVKSPTDSQPVYKSAFDMIGDWAQGAEIPDAPAA